MSKFPKSFRLSSEAVESLSWLVSKTGSSETAIVEMALMIFRNSFQVPESEPEHRSGEALEPGSKLKRKKHRRRK